MRGISIALSGTPGSGKTTYARFIARRYGLRYVSNGMLFREMARERGVSLLEFHRLAEEDESIDLEVDRRAMEAAREGCVVVEGHLAAWVLRDVVDVVILIDAPVEVRARRVAERDGKSVEEALAEIREREESNAKRAKRYYGVDIKDYRIADLYVRSYPLGVRQVECVIASFLDSYREERPELFSGCGGGKA